MSFERVSRILTGDTPGRQTELNYYRIGPPGAGKKVYLQAALHADEQPGILVLHHLLGLLRDADAAGRLKACFVVFPMVNPLGMGDIEFGQHQGRYNRATGVNHNRAWPSLFDALPPALDDELGDDADVNIDRVRALLRNWVQGLPQTTALDQWRQVIIGEACDADYVFDVHCDDDALIHIFTIPQLKDRMQRLANRVGAAATMLAEDSGGGSFDEVWPAVWLRLSRQYPDKPLPLPLVSCTLEYRGQFDCFDAINRQDAENLYAYFQDEGLIDGEPAEQAEAAAAATDLRATEYLQSPAAGLLAYRVELGSRVAKGDCIAELIQLDGEGAFLERRPILAGTSGLVISRRFTKYVWAGTKIAKIVGAENLESRGNYLLGD